MKNLFPAIVHTLGAALIVSSMLTPIAALADSTVTVGGAAFVSKGLVAVGRVPSNQRDKFGETFGSGSGMSIDSASWSKDAAGYKGKLWLLPDRGYNVDGTTDYRERLNTLSIALTPTAAGAAPAAGARETGVKAELADTSPMTRAPTLPGLIP